MDKTGFEKWLNINHVYQNAKLSRDCISRVSRIEKELVSNKCHDKNLDTEFDRDSLSFILRCMSQFGKNEAMSSLLPNGTPIGKSSMGVYRAALCKYITFKKKKDFVRHEYTWCKR